MKALSILSFPALPAWKVSLHFFPLNAIQFPLLSNSEPLTCTAIVHPLSVVLVDEVGATLSVWRAASQAMSLPWSWTTKSLGVEVSSNTTVVLYASYPMAPKLVSSQRSFGRVRVKDWPTAVAGK